jgi:hypothetical protein
VIVLDAGGTISAPAWCVRGRRETGDLRFQEDRHAGHFREVSAKEFFSVFADEVERLLDKMIASDSVFLMRRASRRNTTASR